MVLVISYYSRRFALRRSGFRSMPVNSPVLGKGVRAEVVLCSVNDGLPPQRAKDAHLCSDVLLR
jgi:hypothetical protein